MKLKEKRFEPGDLVVVDAGKGIYSTAVIIDGRETSLHIMDRPKRIVDTVQYRVFVDGKKKIMFDEEIYKLSEDVVNILR
tara:strand:+ start:82 stop:321 length:240 start_codon:yes stop_codon:yes gene_type:complete